MGHYRSRHLIRPRPTGEPAFDQLSEELVRANRKIAQYAAIIAFQESEIKRLRDLMCQGCRDKLEAKCGHKSEHEHGGCEHVAGGSHAWNQ